MLFYLLNVLSLIIVYYSFIHKNFLFNLVYIYYSLSLSIYIYIYPTLFNIYLDEIITKWQNQDITGIKLSKNHQLPTLLFTEEQVIIANTEDNLQKAAYKLNQTITENSLTISVQKTKSMAFKGRDPVRTKIVIDNKIIEKVNSFNYLGNMVSYGKKRTLITNCIII